MQRKGPWTDSEVQQFLTDTRIPIRLSCNGTRGYPVLLSLWFESREGRFWCATQQTSRVANLLRRDPRCAFEVAVESAPYYGVRGQGIATLHDEQGGPTLLRLIDRYLDDGDSDFAKWLVDRSATETAIAIEPENLFSWDYRTRMGNAE